MELDNGKLLMLQYNPKAVDGKEGSYVFNRWESTDQGRSLKGPIQSTLELPTNLFAADQPQWFDSNLIQMPDGSLLSVLQGKEADGHSGYKWRSFLVGSSDRGATWKYRSMIADWSQIVPLQTELTKTVYDCMAL